MRFLLFTLLLCFNSSYAGEARINKIKSKLGLVDGLYKPQKGSHPNCVSGRFAFVEANNRVVHLTAAESIFASNVHTKFLKSEDDTCVISYRTQIKKKGFTNVESMKCISPSAFYNRELKIKFASNKIKYSLLTQSSDKAQKQIVNCVLKRVSK